MRTSIIRPTIAVVLGLVSGFIVMAIMEAVSSSFYPPPATLDRHSKTALEAYIQGLPIGAFMWVLAAHGLGAFVAGFVFRAIVGKPCLIGACVVGGTCLLGGISNLLLISHPIWFTMIDPMLYLPMAILGGMAIARFLRTIG